ncbi:2-oxo acid dehydrogenase subunit E2, partial [Mycoplasmopsis bovis]|uniref:2-oxo acid dehydrogenase subunit E2 n=1 Tax=Mycoplasmopsis bovis TaxID=28903 RepID=UPI003D2A0EBA
ADVTNLWNLRAKVKDKVFEEHNVKLTFLSWIVKASAIALSEYPSFAARWDGVEGKVYYPGTLNIAIAVDTPFGLFVPVIRGVDNLTISFWISIILRFSTPLITGTNR